MTPIHPTPQALARDLIARIKHARDERGTLSVEDLTGLIESVLDAVRHDVEQTDALLHKELGEIAQHIHQTRQEMANAIPSTMSSEKISDATNELGAVLEVTENAANIIMDAADEIQTAVTGTDHYVEKKITGAVTRIYEACNFQDLAGQRVNKVIRVMGEVEQRIARLLALLNGSSDGEVVPFTPPSATVSVTDEKSLMNGPQMPDQAPTQDDIDKLFGSL